MLPWWKPGRSLALGALVAALAVSALAVGASAAWLAPPPARAADEQITLAVHISLAPTWFDPAETPGVITPFARDLRPEGVDRRPGPAEREHPWAVASGAVLFLLGLALAVVARVVRPE